MWDLTVPGGNDHGFYVNTAAAAILVHNCGKNQGIYIFDDLTKQGSVYIGKSLNLARRLADHIGAGRLGNAADAICIQVCGDDVALRIQEHIFKSAFQDMGFDLSSGIERYGENLYNARQAGWTQLELPFEG